MANDAQSVSKAVYAHALRIVRHLRKLYSSSLIGGGMIFCFTLSSFSGA
jgi:hypothetical protein